MFTLESLSSLDPVSFLQWGIIACATILLFLLLFTLRDILLRTRSFWYQAACVLIVGALPIVGFLVYLLIRPARTVKEREMESLLHDILGRPTETHTADYAEDLPSAEPADSDSPTL